jgi:hypothetical protein
MAHSHAYLRESKRENSYPAMAPVPLRVEIAMTPVPFFFLRESKRENSYPGKRG